MDQQDRQCSNPVPPAQQRGLTMTMAGMMLQCNLWHMLHSSSGLNSVSSALPNSKPKDLPSALMGGMNMRRSAGENATALNSRAQLHPNAGSASSADSVQDAADRVLGQVLDTDGLTHFLHGFQEFCQASMRFVPLLQRDPPAVLWQQAAVRLLDYGSLYPVEADAPVVLFIPSLINRAYILDLMEEHSITRYLAAHGVRVLLLDWGSPGEVEQALDVAGYITTYLGPALRSAAEVTGQPVHLAGYCMGGMMALAAAQQYPHYLSQLLLLATPWDFHADERMHLVLGDAVQAELREVIAREGGLPPWLLQPLFYRHDPLLYARKFMQFHQLEGEAERDWFVALESWTHDGVALGEAVAHDCLFHWPLENRPARGNWKVNGLPVRPEQVTCPIWVAMAQHDTVVPPAVSHSLTAQLAEVDHIRADSGHVGMIVGRRAESVLWKPLLQRVIENAGQSR